MKALKSIATVFDHRVSAAILQGLTGLLALASLFFLLYEPHLEGRNVDATAFVIYFQDPFLAYVYLSSTVYFTSLYRAFQFFGYLRRYQSFSRKAVRAITIIKHCGLILIFLVVIGEVFIFLSESDDRAGGVAIGLFLGLCALITTAVASVVQGILERGKDPWKSGS